MSTLSPSQIRSRPWGRRPAWSPPTASAPPAPPAAGREETESYSERRPAVLEAEEEPEQAGLDPYPFYRPLPPSDAYPFSSSQPPPPPAAAADPQRAYPYSSAAERKPASAPRRRQRVGTLELEQEARATAQARRHGGGLHWTAMDPDVQPQSPPPAPTGVPGFPRWEPHGASFGRGGASSLYLPSAAVDHYRQYRDGYGAPAAGLVAPQRRHWGYEQRYHLEHDGRYHHQQQQQQQQQQQYARRYAAELPLRGRQQRQQRYPAPQHERLRGEEHNAQLDGHAAADGYSSHDNRPGEGGRVRVRGGAAPAHPQLNGSRNSGRWDDDDDDDDDCPENRPLLSPSPGTTASRDHHPHHRAPGASPRSSVVKAEAPADRPSSASIPSKRGSSEMTTEADSDDKGSAHREGQRRVHRGKIVLVDDEGGVVAWAVTAGVAGREVGDPVAAGEDENENGGHAECVAGAPVKGNSTTSEAREGGFSSRLGDGGGESTATATATTRAPTAAAARATLARPPPTTPPSSAGSKSGSAGGPSKAQGLLELMRVGADAAAAALGQTPSGSGGGGGGGSGGEGAAPAAAVEKAEEEAGQAGEQRGGRGGGGGGGGGNTARGSRSRQEFARSRKRSRGRFVKEGPQSFVSITELMVLRRVERERRQQAGAVSAPVGAA